MTQEHRARRAFAPGFARMAALVLAALTLCAALASRPAQAAEWMEPYLDQVRAWGVMRGDANGNMNEDRPITRAEFVTLVNRAFGYTETGPHTFADVRPGDWFAEDISIAHNVGYFQGTSPTTAAPLNLVSREQAAVLLGRSLRLQGVTGAANSTFTDMQSIGGWSRGLVQEAADLGIIQGYPDGSFRPDQSITRGQMACFLVRALGTLIQEPGEQASGGVYGNLTITTPGVKLKDTTVTGNLYLTGGVGLGNVELENVEVLGKIIICGSGEAEKGEHSIILRNVTAPVMEVDSITGQFLSVQAEGLTDIGEVTVRTPSFMQDLTEDGLGFQNIRLDGDGEFEGGVQLQLAGNLKNVVNLTPNSALQIAQGVADVVTIDEKAVDSTLTIDNIASIKELNLDRGTEVTGQGSISHVNINAPGSNVEMLPDTIFVRPGITGNVNRVNMDNKVATESSEEPRLLARYPYAKNIAPTSADAVFSTNKSGTVYWGLTALMDGSLGEEELMNPTSYSAKVIRNGTVAVNASNTEVTARLTGLTRSGSYYISALLVDARGHRSPVKVAAFTTPDDSAPNFSTGYPQAPILTLDGDNEQVAQIMVMATKDCQMYYALMPRGSAAPTAADFRAGALPGNLGSGIVTLRKNTPFLLSRINTSHLAEKTQYDLYLWLSDADNGKSSAVRRVQLTTNDITPPTIQELSIQSYTATSVTMRFALDEPGVLSWFVAKRDEKVGINREEPTEADKIKIENIPVDGVKVLRKGGPVRASQAGTPVNFTISGLQGQTAYDLYYVAKDTAGNYCVYNRAIEFPFPIKTLDNANPTVEVTFSISDPGEAEGTVFPRVNSDISLEFSEVVRGSQGEDAYDEFLALYEDVERAAEGEAKTQAKNTLAAALHRHIRLYPGNPPGRGDPQSPEVTPASSLTSEELSEEPEWIDFREARVSQAGAKTVITFPGDNDKNQSEGVTPAIKLQSGRSYYFRLEDIEDTSLNPMKATPPNVVYTPKFTMASAIVSVSENPDGELVDGRNATILQLEPKDTEFSPESARWDMLLWAHSRIYYDLYVRKLGEGAGTWLELGRIEAEGSSGVRVYNSLWGNFGNSIINDSGEKYERLRELFHVEADHQGRPYLNTFTEGLEFAIVPIPGGQDGPVKMEAELYTGTNIQLRDISVPQGTDRNFSSLATPLERISEPKAYDFTVSSDLMPSLRVVQRSIEATDSFVKFRVSLNQSGKVYYMAIPVIREDGDDYTLLTDLIPELEAGAGRVPLSQMPTSYEVTETQMRLAEGCPKTSDIRNPKSVPTKVKYGNTGSALLNGGGTLEINIPDLDASTKYVLYLVAENDNERLDTQALCYTFETAPPDPPKITIDPNGTTGATVTVSPNSTISFVLVRNTYFISGSGNVFNLPFANDLIDTSTNPLPQDWREDGTVLDAMLRTYPGTENSIFDMCASANAKKTYEEYISVRPNDVFLQFGFWGRSNISARPSTMLPGFSEHMEGTNYYTLIVVALGENSKLTGFRASQSYYNTSSNVLKVQSCLLNPINSSATPQTTYTGDLEITFNDSLHYRVRNGSKEDAAPVDSCGLGHTLHAKDDDYHLGENGHVNLGFVMSPSFGITLNPPMNSVNTVHGTTIGPKLTFSLAGAPENANITFRTDICASNGVVRSNTANLQITLRRPDANHDSWWLEWDQNWRTDE